MKFEQLNITGSTPLYLQLSEILKKKIIEKEIPVGQKLPDHRKLCSIFKVSKNTANEALSSLTREGLISARPRYGTFVVSSEPKTIDLKRKNEIAIINCAPYDNPSEYVRSRQVIAGIDEKSKEKGMYLLTSIVRNNEDMSFLAEKQKDVAGMIIVDAITRENYRLIKNMGMPFVLIGDLYDKKITELEVDMIVNDDFQGTYISTKHLIKLGHRRIGYVGYSLSRYSWEKEKLRGYEEALKEAGIPLDKGLVLETGTRDIDKISAILNEKIMPAETFTALICEDDAAYAARSLLRESGRRIPEEVSLVALGFTGVTHVVADWKAMGKTAVERLIKRLTNPGWKPGRIIVPFKLVDKGTTKKLG